ncbi:MAG: hypothetical protein QOG68_1358, partial [Solirubrobacteraceae bacterium]|nr:hypothetical protein [Solirubrobacteraceae bacterium]
MTTATAPARPKTMMGRLRSVGRRAGAMPKGFESQIVWLLGSPRSGSTWLLQLLGDHDAVVPINEPLIGWYLGPFMSDLPGMNAEELDIENFTLRRVQHEKRQHFFADEFSDVWMPGLATMLRERFHAHAVRYPAKVPLERSRVVVKEPNGSQSADLLTQALPDSRLLFLLRDGRDVVDSELAANLAGSWVASSFPGSRGVSAEDRLGFVVQSAKKWLWRTEVVEAAYEAHTGPRLTLRYEDLLADPDSHLATVFDWLGVDVREGEVAQLITQHAFESLPE